VLPERKRVFEEGYLILRPIQNSLAPAGDASTPSDPLSGILGHNIFPKLDYIVGRVFSVLKILPDYFHFPQDFVQDLFHCSFPVQEYRYLLLPEFTKICGAIVGLRELNEKGAKDLFPVTPCYYW
jgi:hypothetical protein